MKRFTFILVALVLVSLVAPVSLYAQGSTFIVCGDKVDPTTHMVTNPCGFKDIVHLGSNLIDYLIILSTVLVAISASWSGFLMLSSGGDEGNVKKAKEILRKTIIGFFWVLGAWVVVNTIGSVLLGSDYTFLLGK